MVYSTLAYMYEVTFSLDIIYEPESVNNIVGPWCQPVLEIKRESKIFEEACYVRQGVKDLKCFKTIDFWNAEDLFT